MRTNILLFLCLLLWGVPAVAQQTFTGYYINNEGDTVAVSFHGYKQWIYNPEQITVLSASGEEQVLTPVNTKQVTIEGYDTYRSRRFTRLLNPFKSIGWRLWTSPVDSLEEVQGFLLFITESNGVSLYKYSDQKRENFFVETGGSLMELKHKVYLANDGNKVVEDNSFRQQLRVVFAASGNNDAALANKLARLAYKEDQLEAFFRGAGGKKLQKKKVYPSELMVMGGAAFNTFKASSAMVTTPNTVADYKASVGPVVGLAFYEYSQRNFGRNFFTAQLKYYRFKNTGAYSYYGQEGTVTHQSGVFNIGAGMGRNFIQTPAAKVYAAIMLELMYLPDSKEIYSTKEDAAKESFFWHNFSLQVGLRLPGRLGVWAHYNLRAVDTEPYSTFDNNHRSIQLGVDWKLKKS